MQGNKEQIESAMAEMAVAQLSSRVPTLFDHYVGFEISEIEDDGARAFGLLGFAIRRAEIYVPVIYLGGRIKGTEVMNLAGRGKFVSCTRSWIDYVADKARTSDLGAPGNPPRGIEGGRPGSLEVYRSPSFAFSGSKYASISDFSAARGPAPDLDVPRMLKAAGADLWEDFASLAVQLPEVAEAMFRHYGPRSMEIQDFGPRKSASFSRKAAALVGAGATDEPSGDGPKVVTSVEAPEAESLPDSLKVDLATTGIAVVDPRSSDDKTRLVRTASPVRTTNPNLPGIYKTLSSKTLEPVDTVVVPSPFAIEAPSTPMPGSLVMGAESGSSWFWNYTVSDGNQDRRRVVVLADSTDEAGQALADMVASKGVPISSAKPGSTYVMAREDGKRMSMPFDVVNKSGDRIMVRSSGLCCEERLNGESVFARGAVHPSHVADGGYRYFSGEGAAPANTSGGVWIEGVEADGTAIVETGHRIMVPSAWVLVGVPDRNSSDPCGPGHGISSGIASLDEVEAATLPPKSRKSAGLPGHERLRVDDDGSGRIRVHWRGAVRSWRRKAAAIEALVGVVGLCEPDARELVGNASKGGISYDGWAEPRGIHKTAAMIDIPWPEDMVREGYTDYSGTREVHPSATTVPGVFEGYVDRSREYDPALSNYNMVSGQAGQSISGGGVEGVISRAAQSGMKQVFDMAVASFLMRGGRLGIQIQEDILPNLESGLDRACRLLLRFYWNNDEFASLYGSDGMAEFEDIMLSNIRETGKAVLFLKRKGGNASDTYDDLNSLSEE
jgi:hypothetical protein